MAAETGKYNLTSEMLKHCILGRLKCNAFPLRIFFLDSESLLHPGILAIICMCIWTLPKADSN